MSKKMFIIFLRDLKVNLREFLSLYLIIIPIILSIGINLISPSINDTTVNLALLEKDQAQISYLRNYAKVETFKDIKKIEDRVKRRDDVIGIVPQDNDYYILLQGNEKQSNVEFAKLLLALYKENVTLSEASAKIYDFGRTVPPIKKTLVNIAIIMTSIFGGMIIAFNIIEEKTDKTIRAVLLTPISKGSFILGKSFMGLFLPIYGSLAILLITGFTNINWLQMLIMILVSSTISLLVGFIQGINNNDIISAASGIKLLFLPTLCAIAASEFLADKWQPFFYWIPYYWTYKGNNEILSYTSNWQQIGLYSIIVMAISAVMFIILSPKIQKGIE